MSKAKPPQIKINKSGQIFAMIKNGNIYRLNANVNPAESKSVAARIKDAGAINLKHWTKCEPRPAKQESEPALRDQYLAIWQERVEAAYVACNTSKLRGMVKRKEAKLKALSADNGLRQIIQQELEIAQSWLDAALSAEAS